MKPFEVIDGQRDKAAVVCTWCGERFLDRDGLETHWQTAPRCKRNKNVSSPTQEKNSLQPFFVITGEAVPSEE